MEVEASPVVAVLSESIATAIAMITPIAKTPRSAKRNVLRQPCLFFNTTGLPPFGVAGLPQFGTTGLLPMSTNGQDGYAGVFGKKIDRVQIAVE